MNKKVKRKKKTSSWLDKAIQDYTDQTIKECQTLLNKAKDNQPE